MNILKIKRQVFLLFIILQIQFIFKVFGATGEYEINTGKKYLIEDREEYTWKQAWMWCAFEDAHLVILDSQEKNVLLQTLLNSEFPNITNFWINGIAHVLPGHKNINETNTEQFYWNSFQQPFNYTYWDVNYPNNNLTTDQCVYISKNSEPKYSWKTNSCYYEKYAFICEKNVNPKQQQMMIYPSLKDRDNLLSDDLKFITNYTMAWRELIRKIMRKAEINIVRSIFNLENFIAKLRSNKENKD